MVRKRKDPSYRSLQSKVVIFPGLNPNEKPKEIVSFRRTYAQLPMPSWRIQTFHPHRVKIKNGEHKITVPNIAVFVGF